MRLDAFMPPDYRPITFLNAVGRYWLFGKLFWRFCIYITRFQSAKKETWWKEKWALSECMCTLHKVHSIPLQLVSVGVLKTKTTDKTLHHTRPSFSVFRFRLLWDKTQRIEKD